MTLRLTLLQLSFTHFNSWMPSIFSVLADFLAVHPGFHGEQLHLEEYAALRVLEAVQNQNMQLLVAKKPLRVGQNDDAQDSANESDLERDDGAFRKQEELFGGDGEDCDLTENEDVADACDDTSPAPVDLAGLQRLLCRRSEMGNAAAPGRHRDMDVEMARYLDVYTDKDNAPMDPNGADARRRDSAVEYDIRANTHQQAVTKLFREQECHD